MTTENTSLLELALPVDGELDGTWGDVVNYGITNYVDIAVAGTLTLNGDGAIELVRTKGTVIGTNIGATTAQYAVIKITGTLTTTKVITAPSVSKTYVVDNAATGGAVTFKAAGQTGVSIAVGEKCTVYYNGTDYIKVASNVIPASSITGTLAVANGGTGNTTAQAEMNRVAQAVTSGQYLRGNGTNVVMSALQAADVTGTLAVANGGTGVTTSTGTGSTVLSASPALTGTPTAPTAGLGTNTTQLATTAYVINQIGAIAAGVSSFSTGTTGLTPSAATTGAVTLAGTLAAANGGTAQSTYATGDLLYASATDTLAKRAVGTTGQVLTVSGGVPTWATVTPGAVTFSVKTSNYTAIAGDSLLADTSSGSFTITLPASPSTGVVITIEDSAQTFNRNPLRVARNGNTIMGLAEDMWASINGAFFTLIYNGSTWRIA